MQKVKTFIRKFNSEAVHSGAYGSSGLTNEGVIEEAVNEWIAKHAPIHVVGLTQTGTSYDDYYVVQITLLYEGVES